MTDSEDAEDSEYSVQLNNAVFELNSRARDAIQTRAEYEYEGNEMFSCWWKVADPSQYADGEWEETIHEKGDPVLVIETEGVMVPWDRLDQLSVEMQEVGEDGGMERPDERDNGNGVKTIDPSDIEDAEKSVGRTHFGLTPKRFEEVPSPDGEEPEKIPPKPAEMGDDPALIMWAPEYPDIEHSWSAGEAICSMYNRVEWNVQVKADQPRLTKDKDDSHDHWESILSSYDCEKIAKLAPAQETPSDTSRGRDPEDDDVPDHFENGKYGGGNWAI